MHDYFLSQIKEYKVIAKYHLLLTLREYILLEY
jgi:hypothetical protein